jgi:hypothetical protein
MKRTRYNEPHIAAHARVMALAVYGDQAIATGGKPDGALLSPQRLRVAHAGFGRYMCTCSFHFVIWG